MALIKLRRDSSTNWSTANTVLSLGEPGYDTTAKALKIGDGTSAWSNLAYVFSNASVLVSGTLSANLLPTSGVVANTYGNSSQIPVLTVDATGRITNASTVAVAGVANVVYTEANTTLNISTGDGSNFYVNIGTANSTYQGLIKVVDSTSNTSSLIAASANSVKSAYDSAANAYTNATSFASNASNISTGTLNTARLPATANISSEINVGANVNLTTTSINVGNSTVNTSINATSVDIDGSLSVLGTATFSNNVTISGDLTVSGTQTILNTQTLSVNDNIIILNDGTITPTEDAGLEIDRGTSNSAFILWREVESKWVLIGADGIEYTISTNAFSSNASNITSGTLDTARLPGTANVSTAINVGANVNLNTSSISVGNSTVNTQITSSGITANGANITNIDANNISTGTLNSSRLPTSGVIANTYGNSSQIPVLTIDVTGRVTNANLVAVAGVTNVVYTEANTTLTVSTGDGSNFYANIGTANSTYQGLIKVVDSVSNTSSLVAASANSVKLAYDSAANAYSNAALFASNADNITSGTINVARFSVSGVVANTYGNSSFIPVLTIDTYGRVTSATSIYRDDRVFPVGDYGSLSLGGSGFELFGEYTQEFDCSKPPDIDGIKIIDLGGVPS